MAERRMGGGKKESLVLPSALGWGTCEGLPFAWGGAERGSPTCRCTLAVLTEPAAGRAAPALGSLPGMGFLGEVPAGKGRSLNRWGRPIAFQEGSSSDSPMRPPPKWAPCLAQTFFSRDSKPRRAARALPESPHLQGTGQESWRGDAWGDVLAPAEPGGALWALREGMEKAMLGHGGLLPIAGLCFCPLPCWSLPRASSRAGVQSWCCAEAGKGRVNPAWHSEGKEGPFPFCVCPHPAAGSCLGCTCPAPSRGHCSSTVLGRHNWGGWGGGCAGVQPWERSWVSPWPGTAAASLWVREFGDSSSFSRDAHRRRVHLAVCNFVGLWMSDLPVSATPG